MVKGKYLKGLFESYSKNDYKTFKNTAKKIVEEERVKHHFQLANELESYLDNFNTNSSGIVDNQFNENYLHLLPKDKDSNMPLMETRTPNKLIEDLAYPKDFREKIEGIIHEYENKEIFNAYNLKPKSKLLFCGPPGCGKTISAEAIANELNLPILYTRFDSVVSSYLGETASNLRKLFEFINKGNWVLFFDEFDAIAKTRTSADEHGELKRVVNTFLQLLDAYQGDSIIIAATNHQQLLDTAIWRRFDEVLYFDIPNTEAIEELVQTQIKRYPSEISDLTKIIQRLQGFSHSDIERIFENSIKSAIMERTPLTDNIILKVVKDYIKRNSIYNDS